MRLLHDIMLEQGMPFARKRLQNASGTDVEMLLFPGKAGVLHGIGKHRRVVLFVGREALEEFEQELSGPGSENTRIKLAMDNGKVALVTASRKELESALL